ncbi:MAG: sodium-dependent transporter [Candidatus Gastranaerophilales bacterium]|nr:sodium-dependent transporter [Candidatus Gastranaerophilales bacterium]
MESRQNWSSQFAFIIAAIGSAIGLGNIWRFPYVMGENGGAVFLIAYFFFVFFICSIPLFGELLFGKVSQKDVVGAFKMLNPKLQIFGWLSVLTSIAICSFYFVVGGWIFYYLFKSFSLNTISNFGTEFSGLIASPIWSISLTMLFLGVCMFFVFRGVNKGIEIANKIMMPAFAAILIVLTVINLQLPNAEEGLKFIFLPDWSKFNFSMLLMALGQALFTLSIGMGALLTYGSYLKKNDNILASAYSIIIADVIFAVLAGVMIFPAVFSFGLEPDAGAGLVFITLPKVFAQMPYGGWVSLGFFFLLLFAALTSGISLVEVAVASFIDNFKMKRVKAATLVTLIVGVLSVPIALSFGLLKDITLFGKNLFSIFDFTTSNICLPFNTLIICIVTGWLLSKFHTYIFRTKLMNRIFIITAKFVLPVVFLVLLIAGLKS